MTWPIGLCQVARLLAQLDKMSESFKEIERAFNSQLEELHAMIDQKNARIAELEAMLSDLRMEAGRRAAGEAEVGLLKKRCAELEKMLADEQARNSQLMQVKTSCQTCQ